MPAPSTAVSTTVLMSVPLFAGIPPDQLRELASAVSLRSAPRGTTVMTAGDALDYLYIVLSGRVKVMMGEADGKEVILGFIGPGEFFGEMAIIDGGPRSATVVAVEPCELLAVTRQDFKKCIAHSPDMSMAIMLGLVRRLREADRKIGSLAMLDVYGRVARLLVELSEVVDGQRLVVHRPSKQDIAKMVGASREMVHKVMKDLHEGGYIEERGTMVLLRDAIPPP